MTSIYEGEPSYENATVMLEACREMFEKEGLSDQARKLKGLEVTCPTSAQVALMVLRDLSVHGEADEVRRYTISALLGTLRVKLAS